MQQCKMDPSNDNEHRQAVSHREGAAFWPRAVHKGIRGKGHVLAPRMARSSLGPEVSSRNPQPYIGCGYIYRDKGRHDGLGLGRIDPPDGLRVRNAVLHPSSFCHRHLVKGLYNACFGNGPL